MIKAILYGSLLFFMSCRKAQHTIRPVVTSISESVYASGIVKSKGQYQVYSTVNGIIENIFVSVGDTIKKGSRILSIANETQQLNKENAQLSAIYSDFAANSGKLNEAKQNIDINRIKMKNDSVLYDRQSALWQQGIGTKIELEQRELNYENAKASFSASIIKFDELKRQLRFLSDQSKQNLMISERMQGDYIIKSGMEGIVYEITISKGELVLPQTPLAVIGDSKKFILEMQVDEYDIFNIKRGMTVLVRLDSYKGNSFEARITKILPFMNERSKTFLVEAEFVRPPELLYPNITFEANIVTKTKENALLIPRDFLWNDSVVIKSNKNRVVVKTGLKDYRNVEILQGIQPEDELIKPEQ